MNMTALVSRSSNGRVVCQAVDSWVAEYAATLVNYKPNLLKNT